MKHRYIFLLILVWMSGCTGIKEPLSQPNIIILYVDDLGYGDVGSYGARGVETPAIDKLAESGLLFRDAHCAAATCTPSRYALLTGSYAFRNNAKILPGDAPLIIRPTTSTIATMLGKQGYKTAVVGKWHLGLGNGSVDWNTTIAPGPPETGFDYSFIIPATGDRVPCVYVENHNVVGIESSDPLYVSYTEKIGDLPSGLTHPELLKQAADSQHSNTIINNISRIGYMTGGKNAWWVDEEFPDILTSKALAFIEKNKNTPFFLYFSFHDIHVPRVPNPRFVGKSTMGPRGDAIAQMDWCVGEIVKKLREWRLEKNTLVIFTSDNGPVLNDGYFDDALEKLGDHHPSGPFRGGKYSAYEAGTRVPAIVCWPGVVDKGESSAMWSQVDLYASIASLVNYQLQDNEAPDSFDMLETILGRSHNQRPYLLEESFTLGLRQDQWKYIAPYTDPVPEWMANKDIEPGLSAQPQLYNLANDQSEQRNLAAVNPEKLAELQTQLNEILNNETTR